MLAIFWRELDQATREVIVGLGGFATGAAMLAFLGKGLLKQLFKKDLQAHKAKLEIEVAKAKNDIESQSNRQLEMLKNELSRSHDKEVEQFKSRLEIASHERRTTFEMMHRVRADAVAEVYTNMVKAFDAMFALRRVGPPDHAAGVEAQAKVDAFWNSFENKRIFFSEELAQPVLDVNNAMCEVILTYQTDHGHGPTNEQLDEMERLRRFIMDRRTVLANEFRRILGVEVALLPTPAPPAPGV